ncbi:xylulokinase [Marinilabilia salmonicolor]|jgi:xylulokinase|uniref:xylulokinase n=1 Tax=Marinilabilia salmonicolor TaxID=989 RepID=UPI000D07B067|nr:FGGY family carbohydrate kinase [Marinilabilia salmonicolor]PRZ00402.1 xylulokinase [Marinilabilia salmonicolor]
MKYTLGFDIGSSSVKVSLLDIEKGTSAASAFYPKTEMAISVPQAEWAEQAPEDWWENIKNALKEVLDTANIEVSDIKAIGITYQMHGLVALDKDGNVVRPSIIWCDSRAVDYGREAFKTLGEEWSLNHLLNSPGNFTAAKLKWVKENEPEVYQKIDKIMLPGDYIAYRLTGKKTTTLSGLSEGIFVDFQSDSISKELLQYFGFDEGLLPEQVGTFAPQGELTSTVASELGLPAGIPVAYRAGDQPNNAFSLNVLEPGEVAATAGTSGVVYGVSDRLAPDPKSRVNTFAHVNHTADQRRLGILLCINGTGILNAWLRQNTAKELDYPQINEVAMQAPVGAEGLRFFPFGNGAERVLEDVNPGAVLKGLNFNIHKQAHLLRAGQEGIAFSFRYGMDIMGDMGVDTKVIRAGKANMFLSPLFRQTLANLANATIELYDTDGSLGAARGAAVGAGIWKSPKEAFDNLTRLEVIKPDADRDKVNEHYEDWKQQLNKLLK